MSKQDDNQEIKLIIPGKITIYDPPSGWKYGFPRQYLPLEGESMADTLIRDGYPKEDADFAADHTRFWHEDPKELQHANQEAPAAPPASPAVKSSDAKPTRGAKPQAPSAPRPQDPGPPLVKTPECVPDCSLPEGHTGECVVDAPPILPASEDLSALKESLEVALRALESLKHVGAATLQALEGQGGIGAKLATELANIRDYCLYTAKAVRARHKL